jgi:hypothetical protein
VTSGSQTSRIFRRLRLSTPLNDQFHVLIKPMAEHDLQATERHLTGQKIKPFDAMNLAVPREKAGEDALCLAVTPVASWQFGLVLRKLICGGFHSNIYPMTGFALL